MRKDNKHKLSLILILSLTIILIILLLIQKNRKEPANERIVIITINDVSPAFSLEQHKRLFLILDKYNISATMFVIPNYLGLYNVTSDEAWFDLIKQEQNKGYEIAQHGYKHFPNEFALFNYSEAKEEMLKGRQLLEQTFGPICGWGAPYWAENYEVTKALNDSNYCYDASLVVRPYSHAWPGNDWVTDFVTSQIEFKNVTQSGKPYIVVLHVEKMDEQGYTYLNEFLSFALENNATFRTYREVFGNK